MACTVQRDPNTNEIQKVFTPKGQESILFNELNNQLGDKEKALDAYSYVYTDNFINAFGNWQKDKDLSDLLDTNGEPLLEHALNPPIKSTNLISVEGYTESQLKDITDLLINKYINSVKAIEDKGRKVKTGQLLNSIRNSFLRDAFSNLDGTPYTGDLKVLKEYLENIEEVEENDQILLKPNDKALRILKINNIKAESPLSEGHPQQDNHEIFLDVHDQWFDIVEGEQQNIERLGFQTMMANRMKNYGLKMSLGQENLQETEKGSLFERIYSRARVQEDMRSKISQKIKTFLATIESNETGFLGYNTFIPFEIVYADLQKGLAGSMNYADMNNRLRKMAKSKPHIKIVLDKLINEDENLKSAFYFTFALNKNNFILFKETPSGLIIMDAKRNSLENKYMTAWRANAVQKEGSTNPRHLYKIKETEEGIEYKLNSKIANNVVKSWNNLQDIYELNEQDNIPDKLLIDFVSFLRNVGIDVTGKTVSDDLYTLRNYFNSGDNTFSKGQKPLVGVALFKAMLQSNNHQLIRVIDAIAEGKKVRRKFVDWTLKEKPSNIYISHNSILSKFTAIPIQSETDMFGSFINSKGNSIFPINMPTVMDDLVLDLQGRDSNFFENFYKDPFFNPVDSKLTVHGKKVQSLWLRMLNGRTDLGTLETYTKAYKTNFRIVGFEALRKMNGKTLDFSELNKKNSMYTRMGGFLNPGGKAGYALIPIPNLSDRSRIDFLSVPTIESLQKKLRLTEEEIIKGFIIQDAMRVNQSEKEMDILSDEQLIPNYHYDEALMEELNITDKRDPRVRGNAFKMQQLTAVENEVLLDGPHFGKTEFRLSDVDWAAYLGNKPLNVNRKFVDNALNGQISQVQDYINQKAAELLETYKNKGLLKGNTIKNLSNPYTSLEDLFRSYVVNTLFHQLEIKKFTRGGISYNKSYIDFSKRFGNMQTPGYKLLLKGDLGKDFQEWGFFREFNEGLMSDFFTTSEVYDEIGDSITQGLIEIEGMTIEEASRIGNMYKGGQSNKSDAFGVVSLNTFRAMRQGMGQWEKEDEEAYQNYVNAPEGSKRFVDNTGKTRRLEPIKSYYDKLVFTDGKMVPQNTKNSYMVLTEEFTRGVNRLTPLFPTADLIRQRLEGVGAFKGLTPMHVINTESTKKLARIGVTNLNVNPITGLINMPATKLAGNGFRIPQIVPEKQKGKKGTLGRQFMINIIAGVDLVSENPNYKLTIQPGQDIFLTGLQVFELYNNTIATMIDSAYNELMGELGYIDFVNAKGEEKQIAKLKVLQNLRDRLREEASERELPENYMKALDIVQSPKGEWRFKMPLAFPAFKRKFEGILMGVLKNRIIKQKINGGSAKQIAELGGHVTTDEVNVPTELKFIRYENGEIKHAEVAIRSDIAKQFGLRPGMDLNSIPTELKTLIGYRIPNQSKNSDIPLVIKHILPENYDQAIVVPGGITTQMGSDFDIDTLYLLMPNVKFNKDTKSYEKIRIEYQNLFDNRGDLDLQALKTLPGGRKALENIIIDVAESVLTSREHFKEVVTPLDSPDMKNIAEYMKEALGLQVEFDHNDPMTEMNLEEINKDGLAGVGMYANGLTGKNIAQYSSLRILGLTPNIDGIDYNDITKLKDNKGQTKNSFVADKTPELIEFIISKRISSSVDNAKNPDMYYRNDNYFTGLVHLLFDSVGINEYDTHNFMNQPIIRILTQVYKNGEFTPNLINEAVSTTLKEIINNEAINFEGKASADIYNEFYALQDEIRISGKPFSMDSSILEDLTGNNGNQQLKYLLNFIDFFKTARGLNTAYKVLNQDKGGDKGTFGGLLEFKGLHEQLLEGQMVSGVDGVVNGSEYVMQKAFARAIERMLNFGGEFFIHQKESVRVVKEHIRVLLNKENLKESDHRNMEEAMFLYMMSNNESNNPLKMIFSEDNITRLLLNRNTSLVNTIETLKQIYPGLNDNAFIANIIEHPENLRTDMPLTRIRFQNLFSFSKFEKDMFTDGLKNLFFNPQIYVNENTIPEGADLIQEQQKIKDMALDFVRVSLLSHGYTPGHDTFIDLIPLEMQTRSSNYFYQELEKLGMSNYFGSDFAHKFIRNFYYTDIVPNIKIKARDVQDAINNNKNLILDTKDPRVYSKLFGKPVSYFTVNTKEGKVLFVLETSNDSKAAYAKSSTLGIPYGLKELNIYDAEGVKLKKSVGQTTNRFIRTKGSNTQPRLTAKSQRQVREIIVRQDEQAEKNCI